MSTLPASNQRAGPAPTHSQGGSLRKVDTSELWASRHSFRTREELVRRFLPLARRLAARYRNPTEPLEDLMQVASLGLVRAIDRFEPDRGTSFSSYAIPTILGELKRHFRDTGWAVRVPRGTQELALRVATATQTMTDQLGRSPQVDELADFMHISMEDVLDGLQAGSAHYGSSLDAPVPNDEADSMPLIETVGAEDDRYALVDTKIDLAASIRTLPYLERQALALRLRDDLKQSAIAEHLGCSQMQVSRLLARAAARLRDAGDHRKRLSALTLGQTVRRREQRAARADRRRP
jgi:RNA polymerase sigma-B factor